MSQRARRLALAVARLLPLPLQEMLKTLRAPEVLRLFRSEADLSRAAGAVWRAAAPHAGLTCGRPMSGDAFVGALLRYAPTSGASRVLELGPGYGRILRSFLFSGAPFARYVGVDASHANVRFLSEAFTDPRLTFLCSDFANVGLREARFDLVYSSLTLKHQYPDFSSSLRSVGHYLEPGAALIFDLIEGRSRWFEPGSDTYVRRYSREEARALLDDAGFALETFDSVLHAPGYLRLLVVSRKR